MNMTALMVGILRVEERGNEHASQAIDIDSRSTLQKFSDWLKTHPSTRDNKIASQDKMCFPE
jgi:hemerythrin